MTPRFLNLLTATLVDDTANQGQGTWRVDVPLVFQDSKERHWIVPQGFHTDFATVKRAPIAYVLTGNRAHRAATLHDWLIVDNVVPRREADDLFLEAMQATGIPKDIANIMHLAVRGYTDSLEPPGPEGRGHEFV